jgi:tetratricopeptide (TPR) repeat protein
MNGVGVIQSETDKQSEVIDWDEDVPISSEDSYQAMRRALQRTQGFSLFFVRCSPIQANHLIDRIQQDLPQKQLKVLTFENETKNLYDLVAVLPKKQNINILFIRGLEHSLLRYEEKESLGLSRPSESKVYGGTWAGIPPLLGHLNLSRERFRDSFSIAFVFLLPEFALRYFIRRAPDFFDWRSGIYDFPTEKEPLNSEAYRLVYGKDTGLETYRTWIPKKRLQRLTEIRACLSESPDNERASELWHEKGLIHAVNEQAEEAIASYDQALKIKPDYHEAWNNRGIAFGNLNRMEEAIASYDQVLKIKPDDHEAWNNRGIAFGNLNRMEEAIVSYNQALKIKPDYHEAWYNLGIALIASYDQALKIKPDDHEAWYNRGIALDDLGRLEEAITSYDRALKIKPDYHSAWYNRGTALHDLGRYEEAIASYETVLKIKPDDHEAWDSRGIALHDLGRLEEAITSYDRALKIKPDYHSAWYNRGTALHDLYRLREAIASYDNALKIKPDYHSAWYNRGIALWNLGRFEEAITSYDRALKIKPDYHSAWYNRGTALHDLGRLEEAITSYDNALKINPDSRATSDIREIALRQLRSKIEDQNNDLKLNYFDDLKSFVDNLKSIVLDMILGKYLETAKRIFRNGKNRHRP